MPDAAGSIAYDVDCQILGESPGEIPLTRRLPIEYSTYDLATGSCSDWPRRAELSCVAPRRSVGVNAEMYALHRAEPRVTLRGVVRLSLGRDNFQDARPLETRARARALSNGPRRAAFLLSSDTRHWSMIHLSRRN